MGRQGVLLVGKGEVGGNGFRQVTVADRGGPHVGDIEQDVLVEELFQAITGPPGEDVRCIVGGKGRQHGGAVGIGGGVGGRLPVDVDRRLGRLAHCYEEILPGRLVVGEV